MVTFAVSGTYHRIEWGRRMLLWMRRLDHASIFTLAASAAHFAVVVALVRGG